MKQEHGGNGTRKFGMVIDLDLCTGCGSCMVACMAENNVPFREDETDKLKSITWMRVYKLTNAKPYPERDICYLPRPCQHCEGAHGHSPCVSVCPATATDYDNQTGIVSQIYTRCFGCRYCMGACPYHARYFNWYDPIWPEGMEKYLNPSVSPECGESLKNAVSVFIDIRRQKTRHIWTGRRKSKKTPTRPPAPRHALPALLHSGISTTLAMPSMISNNNRMPSGSLKDWGPIPRSIIYPAVNGSGVPAIII